MSEMNVPTTSVGATCHDFKSKDVQESRESASTSLTNHLENTCHETTHGEKTRNSASTLSTKQIESTCHETTDSEESRETTSPLFKEHIEGKCHETADSEESRKILKILFDKHIESTCLETTDAEENKEITITSESNHLNDSHDKHFVKEHNSVKIETIDNPDGISKFVKSLLFGTARQKILDKYNQPSALNGKQTEDDSFHIDDVYQEPHHVHTTNKPTPNVRVEREVTDAADSYASHLSLRGYMVIIVNETFRHQTERKGSSRDLQYLHQLARTLGFIVYNKYQTQNVSRNETLQILREMSRADHSGCDMFMFAISTHGIMQPNPRAKGQKDHALICADDKMIFTSSITEMFNDENCPSLKNKPKIFVIQACRGEGSDSGCNIAVMGASIQVYKTQRKFPGDSQCAGDSIQQLKDDCDAKGKADSGNTKPPSTNVFNDIYSGAGSNSSKNTRVIRGPHKTEPKQTPYYVVDTPSLRCDNDQLVMYAIPQGQMAWRNESVGSWLLYYMHMIINGRDSRQPLNLLKTLTKVSAQMSMRTTNTPSIVKFHGKKAISIIEHKLTRDVILTPKHLNFQVEHTTKYRQTVL